MFNRDLCFAMVAGEASGDLLAAHLIQSLKQIFPNARFVGIGGEAMQKEGFQSLYPMEPLSVMGLIEPLKRLPEILSIRKHLLHYFKKNNPALFIGVDAPDFNLGLALKLKNSQIKTVHYVSPTLWAWRSGRIHKIKKAVDLMLTLFPFETSLYQKHQVNAVCVGHPLASQIPMHNDKMVAREKLGLNKEAKIVALLPGSREQELRYMAPEFIKTAQLLHQQNNQIQFITASANDERTQQFIQIKRELNDQLVQNFPKKAIETMCASDVILLTSGTASLQAMLVKRPTLIAYKTAPWVFALAKRLIKVPYIGMPNILANECIMPEFIQSSMRASLMAKQITDYLENDADALIRNERFELLHQDLKKDSGKVASEAIQRLLE